MSTADRYAVPTTTTDWDVKQNFTSTFRWEYEDGRASLLSLYERGRRGSGTPRSASTGRRSSTRRIRSSCPTSRCPSSARARTSA